MFEPHDFLRIGWKFILADELSVGSIPQGLVSIGDDRNGGWVSEHGERVLHCVVIPAVNCNRLSLHPVTVTILAEVHAVPEALAYAVDVGRYVENSRGQEDI